MVSGHEHFSIPSQDVDEVEQILTEESKKRNKSNYICEAIREKRQRESHKTIDDFQTPHLELDFLPRVNEPLTKDHLKQINDNDVASIMQMAFYNKKVIEDHFDSLQRWKSIKKELNNRA